MDLRSKGRSKAHDELSLIGTISTDIDGLDFDSEEEVNSIHYNSSSLITFTSFPERVSMNVNLEISNSSCNYASY